MLHPSIAVNVKDSRAYTHDVIIQKTSFMSEKRGNNPKERKSQDYKQTNFLEQLKFAVIMS